MRWHGDAVAPFDRRGCATQSVFVGHLPALKDELTAEENLARSSRCGDAAVRRRGAARGARRRSRSTRSATLPARVLSQGQRRRIGLARLRSARAPLWILDEPATALDAAGIALARATARRSISRAGGTVVAATHQPLDAAGRPRRH